MTELAIQSDQGFAEGNRSGGEIKGS
jgi:hypothetical protein